MTLTGLRAALADLTLARRLGTVRSVGPTSIVADGPEAALGEVCSLWCPTPTAPGFGSGTAAGVRQCEVVGVQRGRVILMPVDEGGTVGVSPGWRVEALGRPASVAFGEALIGRVVDGAGRPIDGGHPLQGLPRRPIHAPAVRALQRPAIDQVMETGVRAIDALLTLGRGQRVGIFAGSGVGKSSLLGAIARHARADVHVVALVGERGREVGDFITRQLDDEARKRCVVVVATSDQPALARVHATRAALAIAEGFRDQGRHVVLTLDSVTRFAMALREAGLAAGEPPTSRGYTPSVWAELPLLCERCGTAPSGGSITALFAVLVEGDDPNEPVADHMRAALDGHIVLSRALAHRAHFPAIDVNASTSRLFGELVEPEVRPLALQARRMLDLLERNRQAVELGAYSAGAHPELDAALQVQPALLAFLQQGAEGVPRADALRALQALMPEARAGRPR